MKVLVPGHERSNCIDFMLELTSISSPIMVIALKDHLVEGMPITKAAAFNSVPKGNLKRTINRLEAVAKIIDKIKMEEQKPFSIK